VDFDILHAKRLVKEGGIVCGDDLELQKNECDVEYGKKHLEIDFIRDLKTGVCYHPGVTFAVWKHFGRVRSYSGFWAVRKEKNRWNSVDLNINLDRLEIPPHLAHLEDYIKEEIRKDALREKQN
jgi:hypothetical protein